MSKPDWCPQRVWMDVGELFHTVANNHHAWGALEQLPLAWKADLEESIARAILAAEKRGEEREREACAALVDALPIGNLVSTNETDLHRLWRYAGSAQAGAICAAIRARSTL